MALETGSKFGPYEIIEPIGAGGMGEGYRAKDTRLEREGFEVATYAGSEISLNGSGGPTCLTRPLLRG